MTVEDDVKDAIQRAIQMEKDGYAFYMKAALQTSSDLGKQIFESIAKDEQVHLEVFQKMFTAKVGEVEMNALVKRGTKYEKLPVFPKDLKEVEGANPNTDELDALKIAMDSEDTAIKYYTEIKEKSSDEEVKIIFDKIITQEKAHYQILNDEFTHLTSVGHWYGLDLMEY